jgi:hypothetical protein
MCQFVLQAANMKIKIMDHLQGQNYHKQHLTNIMQNEFHGAYEVWKSDGITVHIPKETALKKVAKIGQHFNS